MKILQHKQLAQHIAGKPVLHLNSFGKDSLAALLWLYHYAAPSHIISLNYKLLAEHPGDELYIQYLRQRFPRVEFAQEPNPFDASRLSWGVFQSPVRTMTEFNHWEHERFEIGKQTEDLRKAFECEFICSGQSKYESVTRASLFYKKGLLQGHTIFPLGLMTKKQVLEHLFLSDVKLHPIYKLSESGLDRPSWYKMRSLCIASEEYYNNLLEWYPLMELDKYRMEKML